MAHGREGKARQRCSGRLVAMAYTCATALCVCVCVATEAAFGRPQRCRWVCFVWASPGGRQMA